MNASNNAQQDVISKQNALSAATTALAAVPTPNPLSSLSYTMNCVRLNENQVSADGLTLFVDSSVLALAKSGTTIGSVTYASVDLTGDFVQGVGVSTNPTKIVSYEVVPSTPVGLYPTCVAITLDTPVTAGDGVFYLVGGEESLFNFIM